MVIRKIYWYIVYISFSLEIILIYRKFEEDIESSYIFFTQLLLLLTLYITVVDLSEEEPSTDPLTLLNLLPLLRFH